MSPSLRSEGWSVRPSFVPNGPTSPVTLLADESGFTQLAGSPSVAWQTPWEELANIQLLRFARGMALFATAGGVRYCWRKGDRRDYDQLSAVVLSHGGLVIRQRRRAAVYAVVAVVLLASLAGGIAAWFSGGSSGAQELAETSAVNLTLRDLPTGFFTTSGSSLAELFPTSNPTSPTTTTTTKPVVISAKFEKIIAQFQSCVGVSNAKDRIYGAAGQFPLYQVTSPFFTSSKDEGLEVVSTTQYYDTTLMVHKDTAEMTATPFGTCFVKTQADILKSYVGASAFSDTANFQPLTYEKGWTRGGVTTLTVPNITGKLHLVMVELTSGHYEVTLGALVAEWPTTEPLINTLVSTLLARMKSSTSTAT